MISFTAYGHKNMLAAHEKTYEFISGSELTLKGDCIVGVNCGFNANLLKAFAKNNKCARISIIYEGDIIFTDDFQINGGFCSDDEIVIRKSSFISERTLGIHAKKSAKDFPRGFIDALRNPKENFTVKIEGAP